MIVRFIGGLLLAFLFTVGLAGPANATERLLSPRACSLAERAITVGLDRDRITPAQATRARAKLAKRCGPKAPPAPYPVEDTAIIGSDPQTGTLRIECTDAAGYVLSGLSISGVNPQPYDGTVGAFVSSFPQTGFVAGVSRVVFVDYRLSDAAPAGYGLRLVGTCGPA